MIFWIYTIHVYIYIYIYIYLRIVQIYYIAHGIIRVLYG